MDGRNAGTIAKDLAIELSDCASLWFSNSTRTYKKIIYIQVIVHLIYKIVV